MESRVTSATEIQAMQSGGDTWPWETGTESAKATEIAIGSVSVHERRLQGEPTRFLVCCC